MLDGFPSKIGPPRTTVRSYETKGGVKMPEDLLWSFFEDHDRSKLDV